MPGVNADLSDAPETIEIDGQTFDYDLVYTIRHRAYVWEGQMFYNKDYGIGALQAGSNIDNQPLLQRRVRASFAQIPDHMLIGNVTISVIGGRLQIRTKIQRTN